MYWTFTGNAQKEGTTYSDNGEVVWECLSGKCTPHVLGLYSLRSYKDTTNSEHKEVHKKVEFGACKSLRSKIRNSHHRFYSATS